MFFYIVEILDGSSAKKYQYVHPEKLAGELNLRLQGDLLINSQVEPLPLSAEDGHAERILLIHALNVAIPESARQVIANRRDIYNAHRMKL